MFTHLPGTPQESPCAPELPLKFIFLAVFLVKYAVLRWQNTISSPVSRPRRFPRRAPARLDLVLSPLWSDNQLLGLRAMKTAPQTHKAAAPGGARGHSRGHRPRRYGPAAWATRGCRHCPVLIRYRPGQTCVINGRCLHARASLGRIDAGGTGGKR